MEDNCEKYTIEEIISNGVDFEELWYSSTSDEILDNAEDEGGNRLTELLMNCMAMAG